MDTKDLLTFLVAALAMAVIGSYFAQNYLR